MNYAPHTTPDLIAWLSWIENPLAWSTVMVRADAARRLDPFTRPEILYAEDFDLYHRIVAFGRIARLDEPLVIYRQHDGGVSKRFTTMMRASAARVLAEAHAPLLGDDAGEVARLLAEHNMGGVPIPDGATLRRLGQAIARLQGAFVERHGPDVQSLKLIRWETARRWRQLARVALRSGRVTLGDVLASRPPHLGWAMPVSRISCAGVRSGWCGVCTEGRAVYRPSPDRCPIPGYLGRRGSSHFYVRTDI